ncbi:hypothetical protein BPAE_0069g00380 [Botrytis paeoniae]|uniref:Heterokaryon incompatibility domain-containing protein n=1 Tax=Botrytis paeoniae TaxID=278948 RepID=A0A4Z1FMW9_9HELO|nr:hypothetical protein BPAE_0069g00380 [Botrytis paeoniae]
MPPFSYASLPPLDLSTIRLLSLMPNRDETAALHGQFHNYSLQESDKETHLYEALSYVWGGFNDPPHCIYINGNSLSITANLHAALLRLRNHALERVIWVDALCINQQDDQEKGLQIQLMPRIYGQATRVIVYFGEAADDSDMALESIRVAVNDENERLTNPSIIQRTEEPILELLKRPWFQRIWVLQEVALARNILIKCGSAEINGYLFCTGINKLEIFLEDHSDLQSLVRPVIYIIRRAIFQPRYALSPPGNLSLGELVDMYHTHKATVRHDKVYALLGMSSDGFSSADLLPDYTASWKTDFQRLVKFIMHERISVEAWDNREYSEKFGNQWILHASAQPVEENDLIYKTSRSLNVALVQRDAGNYKKAVAKLKNDIRRYRGELRAEDFHLLLLKESLAEVYISEKIHLEEAENLLLEVIKGRHDLRGSKKKNMSKSKEIVTATAKAIKGDRKIMSLLGGGEGGEGGGANFNSKVTTEQMVNLMAEGCALDVTMLLIQEFGVNLEVRKELLEMAAGLWFPGSHKVMALLVEKQGTHVAIAESVLIEAIGNLHEGEYMIQTLLEKRGESMSITENVVKAVVANAKKREKEVSREWSTMRKFTMGNDIMMQLLEKRGADMEVTEEIFRMIAKEANFGKEALTLLLEKQGAKMEVTEEMVKVIAEEYPEEVFMLEDLKVLYRHGW